MTLTNVINHDDFIFALCTFLDSFKFSDDKEKMIKSPPEIDNTKQIKEENICLLAAAVHKLALEHDIEVPDWVHDSKYTMPSPYFAYDTQNKEYQEFLIKDTPYVFASRNLYVGSNALERV